MALKLPRLPRSLGPAIAARARSLRETTAKVLRLPLRAERTGTDPARRALMAGSIASAAVVPFPAFGGGDSSPPDRRALEAYATWLFYERRLLCLELYPELGMDADKFIAANNAGSLWHFHREGDGRGWRELPQPSTRATAVLDLVGCDWRQDRVKDV